MRLSSRNVFLPDLAFYRADRRDQIRESHIEGAPDLVVEVLDPETLAHRFYRREGELLVEYADGAARIRSTTVDGFFVMRAWLDPAKAASSIGGARGDRGVV